MKTRNKIYALVGAAAFLLVCSANGCDMSPKEGDACNALIVHDECSDGLTCQTIGSCTKSYCCPADAASSKNDFCNGTSCPPLPPDGGDDGAAEGGGGADAGGDSAPDAAVAADGGGGVDAARDSSTADATVGADGGGGVDAGTDSADAANDQG